MIYDNLITFLRIEIVLSSHYRNKGLMVSRLIWVQEIASSTLAIPTAFHRQIHMVELLTLPQIMTDKIGQRS